jgi:hypothetical protein
METLHTGGLCDLNEWKHNFSDKEMRVIRMKGIVTRFVLLFLAILTGWFLRDLNIVQTAHAQQAKNFSVPKAHGTFKSWTTYGPVFESSDGTLRMYHEDGYVVVTVTRN